MMETNFKNLENNGMTISEMETFALGNNMVSQALFALISNLPRHQERQSAVQYVLPCIAKAQEMTLQIQEITLQSEIDIYKQYKDELLTKLEQDEGPLNTL